MFQKNDKENIVKGESTSLPSEDYQLSSMKETISGFAEQVKNIATLNLKPLLSSVDKIRGDLDYMAAVTRTMFGGTEMFSETLKNTFANARASVVSLGGNMNDVYKMQETIMEKLNTQTILNEGEFSKLYSAARLTSTAGTSLGKAAGEIAAKFVEAGYSLNSVGDNMQTILNTAREIGVSTVAAYSQLSTNMATLNTFTFREGVKGMAEMAAQAALLRVDMSKTLSIANQFLDPQKAIEAAGAFQRLGVTIPELLDPMKLGEMSLLEPEKLQQKLGEALAQFTKFNEETGQMSLTTIGSLKIGEIAKELGYSKEEATKFGLSMAKIQKVMSELKLNPTFFGDEKTQELIAGMAEYQTSGEFKGSYTVKLDRGQGESQVSILELSEKDKEILLKRTEDKKIVELAQDANGVQKSIQDYARAINDQFATFFVVQKDVQKGLDNFIKMTSEAVKKGGTMLGFEKTPEGTLSAAPLKKTMDTQIQKLKKEGVDIQKIFSENDVENLYEKIKNSTLVKNLGQSGVVQDFEASFNKLKEQIQRGFNNQTQPQSTPSSQQPQSTPSSQQPQSTPFSQQPQSIPSTNVNPTSTTQTTTSYVEFGGNVNITVAPNEYKQSLLNALNSADVQNKLAEIIKQVRKEENNYQGRGETNKAPSPNFR
jgi:hypothetical protein